MVDIKPLADIAKKWSDVTPGRASFYEAGALGAGAKWSANAAAAEANQAAGVNAAIARKAYAAGIRGAGAEKYTRKIRDVGVARFGPGAAAARTDFESGFAKAHGIIAGLALRARGPKGDPGNYARSQAVGDALHKAKLTGGT